MYTPDTETPTAIIEMKSRLSAIRGVRDGLVQLIKHLVEKPEKRAYLLLINSRISQASLNHELEQLRAALRPEIARRIHIVKAKGGQIDQPSTDIPIADLETIRQMVFSIPNHRLSLPRGDLQWEVSKLLLYRWVTGKGAATHKEVQETIGCSYRTVVGAIDLLGPALRRHSDGRIELRCFPKRTWPQIPASAPTARGTILYADRSGQPRSAESLLRRIRRLKRKEIAVGGVFGAKRFFQQLDIVSAPCLDLCIHAPSGIADVDFIRGLDPALERTSDSQAPTGLAVHFLRRDKPFFEGDSDTGLWCDPVECLIDLYEARLGVQTEQFRQYLEDRGNDLSGQE